MSALAVEQVYRYLGASELAASAGGPGLRLATCGGAEENPYFFHGCLVEPQRAADLLRGLMTIVHARFHIPAAMLERILVAADPVVTSTDGRLRFEGFSGCCGVYARVDLLPEAIDGKTTGRGTTNVDFNAPMLAALAKIRSGDHVELSVGADELRLRAAGVPVVEKKVRLPVRW